MTDRINLTQLRAEANDPSGPYISSRALLALIDTAEAAREVWRHIPPNGNDAEAIGVHDQLRDALAKFTFDPPGRSHPDPFVQGG